MATNFPNSPSINDTFTANDKTWKWDGNVWRSVGVPIEGISGALEYVGGTTVVGSAVTDLTVSGLDLNTDDTYVVHVEALNATGSNAVISLFYNSDTTQTNYDNQRHSAASTTNNSARSNTAEICGVFLANLPFTTRMTISRDIDTTPIALMNTVTGRTVSDFNIELRSHRWRTTSTNVTGITLHSSVASAFAVGSRIRIWKMSTIAQGTTINAPVIIRKSADQSKTSIATPTDDSELFTTLEANTEYEFEIGMFYIVANAPGMRWTPNFTGTVTSTRWRSEQQHNNNANYGAISTVLYAGAYNVLPAASFPGWSNGFGPYAGSTIIKGTIAVGATGGTFSLQWSQSASSLTAATLDAGSYLKIQRLP